MRFAIVGTGGLGCLFGGVLARAGVDVTLVGAGRQSRSAARAWAGRAAPAGERFQVDVRATSDPAEVGPVDAILFCVKTYDVEAAARQSLPMIGPETLILPVQNGVEAAEQIGAIVGEDHVVPGGRGDGGNARATGCGGSEGPDGSRAVRAGSSDRGTARGAHRATLCERRASARTSARTSSASSGRSSYSRCSASASCR